MGAWSLRLHVDNPTFALRKANRTASSTPHSSTRLAEISDGTSNTLMFGEHLHGVFDAAGQAQYHGWNSGFWTDTMIDGYYPINASHKLLKLSDPTGRDYIAMSLESNHPGGANVALCDGSVRFLKDSIDCWPIDPATNVALGVPFNADGTARISINPGAKVGVLQKLSTRNFGDVVSADPIEPSCPRNDGSGAFALSPGPESWVVLSGAGEAGRASARPREGGAPGRIADLGWREIPPLRPACWPIDDSLPGAPGFPDTLGVIRMPVLNAWISVSSRRAGSAVRCMILSRPSCWTVPSHRMILLSSVTIWSWTVAPGGAGISRRSGPLLSMIESIRGSCAGGAADIVCVCAGDRRISAFNAVRLRSILLCEDCPHVPPGSARDEQSCAHHLEPCQCHHRAYSFR